MPVIQLAVLACVLYLQDALLLLEPDEAVLCTDRRGRWWLGFSSDSLRVGARQLYVPNLLLVHRPLFRGRWSAEAVPTQTLATWSHPLPAYDTLAPFVLALGAWLFGVLPLAFWLGESASGLLILFMVLYVLILLAVVVLLHQHARLGVSRRTALGLAAECLLCPPVAVNLVRRLSLKVAVPDNLLPLAEHLLDTAAWSDARRHFVERMRAQLEVADPQGHMFETTHHRLTHLRADEADV